ncbi:MAG: BMP family ABC transporter substrate-binding protein [Spirochaetaceae bacterium]|nr:BMP family ABC transporter substrate-binding protein [Spirochaetaceae bacterium]
MNIRSGFFLVLSGAVLCLTLSCSAGGKAEESAPFNPTILLITDGAGENDESFNQAAFNGILSFYGESWNNQISRGVLYNTKRCPEESDYAEAIAEASEARIWDVIVVTGFTFADPLMEVAPKYPKQKYMIIDTDWVHLPNAVQYAFAEHEGSFLTGAAAALKAVFDGVEQPSFGFIGGVASPTITKFEVGFIQGIYSVLPDAEIVDFYAESWTDPEGAYAQTSEWFDRGVFAVFCAAGETGIGAIDRAKECRKQGRNVWAIGVDADQFDVGLYAPDASAVLTSMIKKAEAATFSTLESIRNNTFKGGATVTLTLAQNGVGFTAVNPQLNPEIADRIGLMRNDIISGRIRVAPGYREALNAGLVPRGLKAAD